MSKTQTRWAPIDWIPGIPIDKYQISDAGDVLNTYTDTLLKPQCVETGYMACTITDAPPAKSRKRKWGVTNRTTTHTAVLWISTAVARKFVVPELPIDIKHLAVYHLDGDICNNHYTNLEWRIGYHRNKMMRLTDRKRMLQLLKDHYTETPTTLSKMILDELGIEITPYTVGSLLSYNKNGFINSKHWELFGIEPPPKRNLRGVDEKLVRLICELICEYKSAYIVRVQLRNRHIQFRPNLVYEILHKISYTKISDEYFDFDEWTGVVVL